MTTTTGAPANALVSGAEMMPFLLATVSSNHCLLPLMGAAFGASRLAVVKAELAAQEALAAEEVLPRGVPRAPP